ncbi:MAG TPA: TonB-dependent receptor [Terriglobales bacterium]|nr:TonB-dependent receptor [Terriglobales bacterium]
MDAGRSLPLRAFHAILRSACLLALCAGLLAGFFAPPVYAQDGSTSLQGLIEDASGARIASATVVVTDPARGVRFQQTTDAQGNFTFGMLPPGRYDVTASAPGMAAKTSHGVDLLVGGVSSVRLRLAPAAVTQTVSVTAAPVVIETQSGDISNVVTQTAIEGLPLNGRRFTDLALLSPDVVQDPRGLTSNSNGDLSVGGVRGFQNSFLVDGVDDNNSFFAQARGRYRAPYQFSNEVIQEFRVSKNSYSAELGRSGGAVFNVVTKSGTNDWHGSSFYFLRDRAFDAQQAFADSKPDDRQQQFGATIGGPLRKDRVFFYAGFDQHLLTVPSIVQFGGGASSVIPQPGDYDRTDQQLVLAAAQKLNAMGGTYPTNMQGNAGFAKLDFHLSPTQLAAVRLSTSMLTGTNNVFFDPASPLTGYAASANGTENVHTESLAGSLISSWSSHLATNLRLQLSRDLQQSTSNSDQPWTKIYDLVNGFGGSSILPRQTRETKLHAADTVSYEHGRMHWKFGGDFLQAWTYNYYPYLFGGEYYFDNLKVNPFTYQPERYGEPLTPLRAFAHDMPRYYMQDFGNAVSHPNSRFYSAFVQNTYRMTDNFTLNLGLRYDLETFEPGARVSNPLYAPSGKVPTDLNNFSPRLGIAYSTGGEHPLVLRAGAGLFYMPIPAMYISQVATDNGGSSQLFLNMTQPAQAALFPSYPNALVNCPPGTTVCTPPASLAPYLTTNISAFASNFQTPHTEQANIAAQRELGHHILAGISYEYVHGIHEIRSLDVNLPAPVITQYPVYTDNGSVYLGMYNVASFATWQTTPSLTCPYPPCINPVQRPNPRLGAINSFESQSSSIYNGMTVSLKRVLNHGMYFQVGYTLAKATDDGPDALVVGRPGNVQNSYLTTAEWGPSTNDERHRFVAAWVLEPKFNFDHGMLNTLANHWTMSNVVTFGSGRPVNATIAGDPNGDSDIYNDRLPGYTRNAFTGPDYLSTDMRITRTIKCGERVAWKLAAESFNLFNRTNALTQVSDDGFYNSAGQFIAYTTTARGKVYPGMFLVNSNFLTPTNAYAPRQIQFSLRVSF